MADEIVSQREFARRVGVSAPAVANAVDSGRIRKESNGKINYTTEVIKWFRDRDTSKIRAHNAPDGFSGDESESGVSINKAKLVRETYSAKLRQLEYEREVGKLIEKEEVKISIFKFCRMIRDSILTIPDRVASENSAMLAAYMRQIIKKHVGKEEAEKILNAIDSHEIDKIVHRIWDKESRTVLENLSEGPK